MKAAIGSSGDAGHVSNLPSLRLDLQRRESRSSPPTVIPFDLRRLLAISDGLKVTVEVDPAKRATASSNRW
ncbi:hypothetical protein JCGZ_09241 [Jatropha curcas]|uniref:Uncharacterized protein n=1 Tax=Jatropha curcas TaxID=180498 RepID=A0A067KIV8_JATCU|nr:hypothetical protein JCGZ_09241 [Jatropha curcas]